MLRTFRAKNLKTSILTFLPTQLDRWMLVFRGICVPFLAVPFFLKAVVGYILSLVIPGTTTTSCISEIAIQRSTHPFTNGIQGQNDPKSEEIEAEARFGRS